MNNKLPDGDLRIGVYVCRCGLNIGAVMDCMETAGYAAGMPDVVPA